MKETRVTDIRLIGEVNTRNQSKKDDWQKGDKHHKDIGVKEGDVLKTRDVELSDGTAYTLELCNAQHWRVVDHPELGKWTTVEDFTANMEKEIKKAKTTV